MRRGRPFPNAAVPRLLLVTTTWGKFAGVCECRARYATSPVNEAHADVAYPAGARGEWSALPRFRPRAALILPIGYVRRSPLIKGSGTPLPTPAAARRRARAVRRALGS